MQSCSLRLVEQRLVSVFDHPHEVEMASAAAAHVDLILVFPNCFEHGQIRIRGMLRCSWQLLDWFIVTSFKSIAS